MSKIKVFLISALCLGLVLFSGVKTANALYGLTYKWFQVVDEQGDPITSGLTYEVQTVDSGSAATIYSTKQAASMTNPTTLPSNGVLGFWFTPSTYDVEISDGTDTMLYEDIGTTDHILVFPDQMTTLGAVDIDGGVITGITDLVVADGGTGASTLTDGGVLLGNATDALVAMSVLADGEIIVGDGTTDPVALAAFSSSTGDLEVTAGGTGVGTLTDGGILLGSATADVTAMGVLADGSIVVGDGTTDPVALAAFSSSTGDLLVGSGGTGVGTLLDHGVVVGSGSAAVSVMTVGADGYMLVGVGSADPQFVALSGDIASVTTEGVVDFTTVIVADGGTGVVTLTDHGVLVGAGTSNVTQLSVGATNEVLRGSTGADPAFGSLVDADIPVALTLTGSTINTSTIGATTPSTGAFTTFACDAGEVGATEIADVERSIQLPLMAFTTYDASAALVPISTSTTPGLETDDLIAAIVWANGEVTPVQITFEVPTNYASGGAFRLVCSLSGTSTPANVDFDIYINQDGVAHDASATNQTEVDITVGTATGVEVVTLTPATDTVAAGDWVTFRMWRGGGAFTHDLEAKGVSFFYTGSQ